MWDIDDAVEAENDRLFSSMYDIDDGYCHIHMVDNATGHVLSSGWVIGPCCPRVWVAKGQWLFFDKEGYYVSTHSSEEEVTERYHYYMEHEL